jgi:hypothetical protein
MTTDDANEPETLKESAPDAPSRPLLIARAAFLLVIMGVVTVALLIVLWLIVAIVLSLIDAF